MEMGFPLQMDSKKRKELSKFNSQYINYNLKFILLKFKL